MSSLRKIFVGLKIIYLGRKKSCVKYNKTIYFFKKKKIKTIICKKNKYLRFLNLNV